MRTIIKILGTEPKVSKAGKPYTITHVVTDVGDEAQYWGTDIKVGDLVEVFYHFGRIKVRKGKNNP